MRRDPSRIEGVFVGCWCELGVSLCVCVGGCYCNVYFILCSNWPTEAAFVFRFSILISILISLLFLSLNSISHTCIVGSKTTAKASEKASKAQKIAERKEQEEEKRREKEEDDEEEVEDEGEDKEEEEEKKKTEKKKKR